MIWSPSLFNHCEKCLGITQVRQYVYVPSSLKLWHNIPHVTGFKKSYFLSNMFRKRWFPAHHRDLLVYFDVCLGCFGKFRDYHCFPMWEDTMEVIIMSRVVEELFLKHIEHFHYFIFFLQFQYKFNKHLSIVMSIVKSIVTSLVPSIVHRHAN